MALELIWHLNCDSKHGPCAAEAYLPAPQPAKVVRRAHGSFHHLRSGKHLVSRSRVVIYRYCDKFVMSRHSKNSSSRLYHSRHEKAKAGYGTQQVRLGADAQYRFGYCPLSHRFILDPVATPSGHLYEREAMIKYLLEKSQELKQARKEALSREANTKRSVIMKATSTDHGQNRAANTVAMQSSANASSFWTPALPTASAAAAIEGSDGLALADIPARPPSPVTGKPLRRKMLINCTLQEQTHTESGITAG